MQGFPRLFRIDGPGLLRGVALLALAIGAGVWGALLFAPGPGSLPPMLQPRASAGQDVEPIARWFGGGALRVRIAVAGLITAEDGRGAALLTVNGSAAQAYRVGQTLAPGVILAAVSSAAVSIDQDGVIETVSMAANPSRSVDGFIRVAEAPTSLAQR